MFEKALIAFTTIFYFQIITSNIFDSFLLKNVFYKQSFLKFVFV